MTYNMFGGTLNLARAIVLLYVCDQGCPDFLGRATTHPQVNLDVASAAQVILQWSGIKKGPTDGGELLFAAELFLVSIITLLLYEQEIVSNSTKGRIVLLNIPTAGLPGLAHLCPPPDCVPWLRTWRR